MSTQTRPTRFRSIPAGPSSRWLPAASLRAAAVAGAVACALALPAHAQDTVTIRQPASKQQSIGVVTGLAVGAAAGGPVGAIVGAAAGGWLGERYHKQSVVKEELAADRARLARNVTELNGSLAHEQEHGEQLDLALNHTDEVQTDVGFRTNDDTVQPQAIPPLQKLGALAAALPGANVRVAGYADPRGSTAVNETLSKRRAEAVAAVLASAGVPSERMIIEAHGKRDAVSAEGDSDGYAFDRRVTVRIERAGPASVARNE
jgi:outer membrane protein OmpA-like peptidoglycan-associated protein